MLKQISIFAENKKGMLQSVTGILARENINIMGSVTNDSAEYGIIRMVVSDPQRALEALSKEGFICRDTDVLGVELDDNPGALDRLINVDYLYLSFNRSSGMPIMILHVDCINEVKNCLQAKGHCVL